MDQFFTDADPSDPQITEYQPPQSFIINNQTQPSHGITLQQHDANNFNFTGQSYSQPQAAFTYPSGENDFNDFEQDETTKRIRGEEERVQSQLRTQQKEWHDKSERVSLGRKQLAEFQARKEQEKSERAQENVQKQERLREQYKKLEGQAGWYKVTANVNLRQGEYKGKKDVTRMREAILHKSEDDNAR